MYPLAIQYGYIQEMWTPCNERSKARIGAQCEALHSQCLFAPCNKRDGVVLHAMRQKWKELGFKAMLLLVDLFIAKHPSYAKPRFHWADMPPESNRSDGMSLLCNPTWQVCPVDRVWIKLICCAGSRGQVVCCSTFLDTERSNVGSWLVKGGPPPLKQIGVPL